MPVFAYDDVPILINTGVIDVDVEKDNKDLIQIQNMKKAKSVKRAKDENFDLLQKPKFKIDTRQIHYQRTLDYMNNRGSGTMLPIF